MLTLIPIVIYPLFVDLPAVVFLGFWFVSQILSGVISFGADTAGGVAWWAHVGGFLTGMILCGILARRAPEQLPGAQRHFVLPSTQPRRSPPRDWI